MRDGIYIRPAFVRLMALGVLAFSGYVLRKEMPGMIRYAKFETM